MRVNVDGVWTEYPDSTPITVAWDPSRLANPNGVGDNAGCPPGYFCEYVAPGSVGSLFGVSLGLDALSGSVARVCRRFDQQISGDGGATLAAETGPDLAEQTAINLAAASSAVVGALTPVLGTTVLLVGAALVGYLALTGRR